MHFEPSPIEGWELYSDLSHIIWKITKERCFQWIPCHWGLWRKLWQVQGVKTWKRRCYFWDKVWKIVVGGVGRGRCILDMFGHSPLSILCNFCSLFLIHPWKMKEKRFRDRESGGMSWWVRVWKFRVLLEAARMKRVQSGSRGGSLSINTMSEMAPDFQDQNTLLLLRVSLTET